MILTVSGPVSLAEYIRLGDRVVVARPGRCIECGAPRLWRHTGYKRTAREPDGSAEEVRIERFRCGRCGLVVSCLFKFLIPYVQYTVQAVAAWVAAYLETAGSTYEMLGWSGVGDQKSTAFRKVEMFSARAAELTREVQTEAMLNRVDNVEIKMQDIECPNSERAHTLWKRAALDAGATLLSSCRELMRCGKEQGGEILSLLANYFVTSAEHLRSVFCGRKRLRLSNQQSLQRAIF